MLSVSASALPGTSAAPGGRNGRVLAACRARSRSRSSRAICDCREVPFVWMMSVPVTPRSLGSGSRALHLQEKKTILVSH